MIGSGKKIRLIQFSLLFMTMVSVTQAQSFLAEIKAEHDPVKRSMLALNYAGSAFDNARELYDKGEIQKGDAQLDDMTSALNECVDSAETAHKARIYKKAEQSVAMLQRRVRTLVEDIGVQERGWAEQTQRRLEAIHDRLLAGAMGK